MGTLDHGQSAPALRQRTPSVMRVDRLPPNSVSAACYRTDPKTGEILAELEDRENHAIDALRYALEGQRSGSTYDGSMRWVGTPVWGWR